MAVKRKKNGAHEIETRLEALQADFNTLQSDLLGLANGVGHLASNRLNGVVHSTEVAAGRAESWASENVGELRDKVRHQPLAACMVSVGVGALMGALFSRR